MADRLVVAIVSSCDPSRGRAVRCRLGSRGPPRAYHGVRVPDYKDSPISSCTSPRR